MKMTSRIRTVTLYTVLHFFVDFTTIFLISGVLLGPGARIADRGNVIILYNLVAFAGQLPMGILSDMIRKNSAFAAAGCLMACLSYPLVLVSPWAACILTALGNGAFHIGAGCEVLKISMPKAGASGVFVSSGAFGVWLAYRVSHNPFRWLLPVIMLISFLVLILWCRQDKSKRSSTLKFEKPKISVVLAVSFFMLTIVIRSLLGMIMNFSWKEVPVIGFLSVMAVVMGKALGGFLGDKFGYLKTAMISLGISLVCFVIGFDYPITGIIGILCFNMTMPLTLAAIANVSGEKYGFAFGLTTFALAIGFIPVVFGANSLFTPAFLFVFVSVSLFLIYAGYRVLEK